jgi:DNA-binding NtrC family response regulator
VLTDLILPDGMAGPELARILQAAKPGLKVLYTSGYNTERLAKEFPPGARVNFVQKPFHARKLAEVVYACLNPKPG